VLIIGTAAGVIFYQDRIISLFWAEINESLKYPVEAKGTRISFWTSFPNLSIVLDEVVITASDFSQVEPLFRARTVTCELSLLDLMTSHIKVKRVHASDGSMGLLIDDQGKANYFILKPGTDQGKNVASIFLPGIQLTNFGLTFSDFRSDVHTAFDIDQISASVFYAKPELQVSLKGELIGKFLGLGELEFEGDKSIRLEA